MFSLKLLFRFADYRYFREIADFMKLKIPLVNQEILIQNHRQCLVYGIKKVDLKNQLPEFIVQVQAQETVQTPADKSSEQDRPNPPEPETQQVYIFQKHSQAKVNFDQALSISQKLGLDLCLIRAGSDQKDPVLNISAVRKQIYSQYYKDYVKRKGKHEYKTIRISDRINQNDIQIKYQNLKRMHQQGERIFRIEGNNDSEKCQKIIKDFAKLFGKIVEPRLKTFKVPPRNKTEERWICNMIFDQEVDIDPKKVNKKWRSYQFQLLEAEKDTTQQEIEDFQSDSVEMERQMYYAYKELNMKLPKKFQEAADLEEAMKKDKYAIYKVEDQEEGEEWDEEEEKKFEEKQARFNREYFGERTLQDILTEMEELKKSGFESEAYKVARFRQLKAELDVKIKSSNKDF